MTQVINSLQPTAANGVNYMKKKIIRIAIKDVNSLLIYYTAYMNAHHPLDETCQIGNTDFKDYFEIDGEVNIPNIEDYVDFINPGDLVCWKIVSPNPDYHVNSIYLTVRDNNDKDVGTLLFPGQGHEITDPNTNKNYWQIITKTYEVIAIASNFESTSRLTKEKFTYTIKFALAGAPGTGYKFKFDPTIQPHVNTK